MTDMMVPRTIAIPTIHRKVDKAVGGFTLLEVLVALAILAIVLAASIRAISQSAVTLEALQDRTEANILLSERLDEWRYAKYWPPLGERRQVFVANGRDWFWTREVTVTPDQDMRKVMVKVGLNQAVDGGEAQSLVSRIAYLRRFHETASTNASNP